MDRCFFGEQLAKIRKEKNLTQKQLGNLVGLPDVRIRQYEGGYRTPKTQTAKDFAEALGVTLADLGFIPSVGDKIREIRKERGFTQFELSEMTGIHLVTLKRHETNVHMPTLDSLIKYSEALGVDINYFLTCEGVTTPEKIRDVIRENIRLKQENVQLKEEIIKLKSQE